MTDRERQPAEPSELEGGGTEQTWGQGEGGHEATIPDAAEEEEAPGSTYSDGTARELGDPGVPLSREDEGMDR